MKIDQLVLKNHPFFGDKTLNFKDAESKTLSTIVLAGNNGCGKTTILETILDVMTDTNNIFENSYVNLNLQQLVNTNLIEHHSPDYNPFVKDFDDMVEHEFNTASKGKSRFFPNIFKNIPEKIRPKIIYMPAEISFEKLTAKEKSYEYKYAFKNVIDKKMVNDVPTYISSQIIDSLIKNEATTAKDATAKACAEINEIFSFLEIDARMIGLKKEGEKLPIFQNSSGKEFDINGLSSGEKQLFVRALTLKMINANNSIILIDEPEISLHPKWQQKIIKVYENIGVNNQIIVATHSPHILSSVKKESVFLLSKDEAGVKIFNYLDKDSIQGKPVSIVLTDFMGLQTDRDPDIEKKIKALQKLVRENNYATEDFQQKYTELTDIIGTIDQDIILLNIEIARKKAAVKGI